MRRWRKARSRLGRIAHDQLRQEYAEYVTLEGIVERRSQDLRQRKTAVELMVADIACCATRVEGALRLFVELDQLEAANRNAIQEVEKLDGDGRTLVQRLPAVKNRLAERNRELDSRKTAGMLRRAFLRSEVAIQRDIDFKNSGIGPDHNRSDAISCRIQTGESNGGSARSAQGRINQIRGSDGSRRPSQAHGAILHGTPALGR